MTLQRKVLQKYSRKSVTAALSLNIFLWKRLWNYQHVQLFNDRKKKVEKQGDGITDKKLIVPKAAANGLYIITWWMNATPTQKQSMSTKGKPAITQQGC